MADAPLPTAAPAPAATPSTPAPATPGSQALVPSNTDGAGGVAPAEPERDPSLPPRHAELGQWAKRQKAQRDEQAQRDADARDAAAYRAMLAQGFTPREATQQVQQQRSQPAGDFDLHDFDGLAGRFKDPGELRQWLNGFAKHIANPSAGRLQREVEALKSQKAVPEDYEEIKKTVAELREERQREQQAATDRAFITSTEAKGEGDAHRYPLLAKHQPAQRFAVANQVIADYRQAGFDGELPMDLILQESESYLTAHYQGLGFLPAQASPAPAAVPDATPAPSKRSPSTPQTRRPPGPRSLSNDHVATPTAVAPQSFQERLELAKQRSAQRTRTAAR